MNIENIDIKHITCFGFISPIKTCWTRLVKIAADNGWKSIDIGQLERSLASNVAASYANLANVLFRDIDTDIDYLCTFDTSKKLWKLEIPDSPPDAVDPAEKAAFFKSADFKRIAFRTAQIIRNALKLVPVIADKVNDGMFISLDEIKYEAVLNFITDPEMMDNLKSGKFVK